MAKLKPQPTPRYMQAWLQANQRGKLTTNQWLELTAQPLLPLLLLVAVMLVLFAFNPVGAVRMVGLARYGGWLIGAASVGLATAAVVRGVRYLALPVHEETLYGGELDGWRGRMRRDVVLYTPKGQLVVFQNHIGKMPVFVPDAPYTVYYLADGQRRILVSSVPTANSPQLDRSL